MSRLTFLFCIYVNIYTLFFFFFSSRRRHTRFDCDWSSDVCSSDLEWADSESNREPSDLSLPASDKRQPAKLTFQVGHARHVSSQSAAESNHPTNAGRDP